MNDVFTDKPTPTAMELLAVAPAPKILNDGVYLVEYQSIKKKHTKESGNYYYEHTLVIRNDEQHEGTLFSILTSLTIKRGRKPKYNTKLYKLVSCLLKRELDFDEKISISDLVGKRCKVLIKDEYGYSDVKEIFREDADINLDEFGVHGLPQ